jgi:hypothetical protein
VWFGEHGRSLRCRRERGKRNFLMCAIGDLVAEGGRIGKRQTSEEEKEFTAELAEGAEKGAQDAGLKARRYLPKSTA